jgi:hypothetical protein
MILAMYAAASEQNVSKVQMQSMLRAVMQEHAAHNVWPKGF